METSDDNREKLQASNAANEIIYFNELTSFYWATNGTKACIR